MTDKEYKELEQKASTGDNRAKWEMAVAQVKGDGTVKNPRAGYNIFQELADKKYPPGLTSLGICYYNGEGQLRDYSKAVILFKEAAELKYSLGQLWLGLCYAMGNGVARDLKKAEYCYISAAKSQETKAMVALGKLYAQGGDPKTFPKNPKAAAHAWEKAAELDNVEGMWWYGVALYNGFGVPKEPLKGMKMLKKAGETAEDGSQIKIAWNKGAPKIPSL
jgi:TPR repeat protein